MKWQFLHKCWNFRSVFAAVFSKEGTAYNCTDGNISAENYIKRYYPSIRNLSTNLQGNGVTTDRFWSHAKISYAKKKTRPRRNEYSSLTYLDFPTALSPKQITLTERSVFFFSPVSSSWLTTSLAAIFHSKLYSTQHTSRVWVRCKAANN